MCLFPIPNLTLKHNEIKEFNCGHCPECLQARASSWAIRAVYEASQYEHNCMVTLTYDNYARDSHGRIIGELPPDRNLHVCKRDVQLFIKRLRKWYKEPIKYLLCAEYGSHTHRAHYHAILFGVKFPDLVPYKATKRGNSIYKSHILSQLWGHGICSVDCININGAVARYCTKYTAKSRSEDTFMLFSHGIGIEAMLADFNGIGYSYQGRIYPIPRSVWEKYIYAKYSRYYLFTYKYVPLDPFNQQPYKDNRLLRTAYRYLRDNDPIYMQYKDYWKKVNDTTELTRKPVFDRIRALPDGKYAHYKTRALRFLNKFSRYSEPRKAQYLIDRRKVHNLPVEPYPLTFAVSTPCLETANDTKPRLHELINKKYLLRLIKDTPPEFDNSINFVSYKVEQLKINI